ncbi:MAG: serine--tRNA ligase [Endozoicomonadaceae bacterium]|nr:serine--tRNA ligase [Endozoicomonadaceae bacterium]
MLDPKLLRNQPDDVATLLAHKNYQLDVIDFKNLEKKRKKIQIDTETLQAERNAKSKQFGRMKAAQEDTAQLKKTLDVMSQQLKQAESELDMLKKIIENKELDIPNIPHKSTPIGKNETDNHIIKHWGTPHAFDFDIQDHVALGKLYGLDFEAGSKLSGARFTVMRGGIATLHRALTQFMLNLQIKQGYEECYTPYLVHENALKNTGQLPKFEIDLFKIQTNNETQAHYLIPTAEVPLTNLAANKILDLAQLPIKLTAHTPCFRSEAGSYGRDTRGMIRQHQFDKIELVQITHPDESFSALEEMLCHAENVLKALNLPYRVAALCSGDLGFSAAKTYDLEVWLPGQQKYREIASISNCTDFQSRRMQTRFKNMTGKIELVHTLNGSGLAVGRTLVAILENYQTNEGHIHIPTALQPYCNGLTILK